jgi:hypothetical protein
MIDYDDGDGDDDDVVDDESVADICVVSETFVKTVP